MITFNNSNVWWTSDWHINHVNLCRGTTKWSGDISRCRDFDTLEAMWEVIRDNTNSLVGKDDILINQGDIIFSDKTKLPYYLDQINCKNILYIFGNHCDWMKKRDKEHYQQLFHYGCYDYKEIVVNKQIFILSHYAMRTWREQGKGSFHTFGHSHSSLPDDKHSLSIDVGVDTCLFGHKKYTPYSFAEINEIMRNHKERKILDHHGAF